MSDLDILELSTRFEEIIDKKKKEAERKKEQEEKEKILPQIKTMDTNIQEEKEKEEDLDDSADELTQAVEDLII